MPEEIFTLRDIAALLHGTTWDDAKFPAFSYTMTHNLTGVPGVAVRGGTSPEGLPIRVQIVVAPSHEDLALAVAQHIQTVSGGWQPPQLS